MSITIRVRNNGPYFISADDAPHVRIEDADGNVLEPPPGRGIVLCRCGMSARKPFCDSTHKEGFSGKLCPTAPDPAAVVPPSQA